MGNNICSPTIKEGCHCQRLQWWVVGGNCILSKEAAPTIYKEWSLLLTKKQEELSLKPINRGMTWRAKWERDLESVRKTRERERGVAAKGSSSTALCNIVCENSGSRVEWLWSSSSMYICCSLFLFLIISTSLVDIDGLPNHVKYCVNMFSLQWTTIRTSSVGIPNIFFLFFFSLKIS